MESGVPKHFVAQSGDVNALVLEPDVVGVCEHGCERQAFGTFATCCTHCKGPSGPHARDCSSKRSKSEKHKVAAAEEAALDSTASKTEMEPDNESEDSSENADAATASLPATEPTMAARAEGETAAMIVTETGEPHTPKTLIKSGGH